MKSILSVWGVLTLVGCIDRVPTEDSDPKTDGALGDATVDAVVAPADGAAPPTRLSCGAVTTVPMAEPFVPAIHGTDPFFYPRIHQNTRFVYRTDQPDTPVAEGTALGAQGRGC